MQAHSEFREMFDGFITSTTPDENGDLICYCPAHENPSTSKKPSASINFRTRKKEYANGVWWCYVCAPTKDEARIEVLASRYRARTDLAELGTVERKENVYSFKLAKAKRDALINVTADLGAPPIRPLPSADVMDVYKESLLEGEALKYLETERGITAETAKRWELGYINSTRRYLIPILNSDGELVNLRLYLSHATEDKMKWYRKGSTQQLFGFQMLAQAASVVTLFEGEWDTILAEQDGIAAVSHTAGAGVFKEEWAGSFIDKVVYICYDADDAGRKGREKVLKALRTVAVAEAVYFIDLPEGCDYTDFRIRDGRSVGDFKKLMEQARNDGAKFRREHSELPQTGSKVTVAESYNADLDGVPLEMVAHVVGRTDPPYSLPRKIEYTCDMDKGSTCASCPMKAIYAGHYEKEFRADDKAIADMLDAAKDRRARMLRNIIKAKCSDHLQIDTVSSWTVEQLTIEETIERKREQHEQERQSDTSGVRQIFNIGYGAKINTSVRTIGTQMSDPRNGRALFMSWATEPTKTSIDEFELTPDLAERFKVFRPIAKQSPLSRMRDIAADLTANVTKIYGRDILQMALDITWHSILRFPLLDGMVDKGWCEMIVIGDSRTGKSEMAKRLSEHYHAGTLYACDQASLAGLVGGVSQPVGRQWAIKWGALPLNDRRLMVLDEAQSLVDKGIIEHMSSIRSNGIAEVTKIETSSTTARTRLIWIANPPNGSHMSALPDGGMDGIRQMMPAHEDIARFDYAMAAGRGEVAPETINTTKHKPVKHKFTSELSAQLVMWAWSRRADQVEWQEGAEEYLLEKATEVGDSYVADFPLVQQENVRIKLARIAVAIAARTFSTDPTGETIRVGKIHINAAVEFLAEIYGNDVFGYGRMSRRAVRDTGTAESNITLARTYFSGKATIPDSFGREMSRSLRTVGGRFEARYLAGAAGYGEDQIQNMIRYFVDLKLLRRTRGGKWIEVQPVLADLLRELDDEE